MWRSSTQSLGYGANRWRTRWIYEDNFSTMTQTLRDGLLCIVGNDQCSFCGIVRNTSIGSSANCMDQVCTKVIGGTYTTRLTRRKCDRCNIIALPVNARVVVSWPLKSRLLHIHERVNKLNGCIQWPDVRQWALESQIKPVLRDVPMLHWVIVQTAKDGWHTWCLPQRKQGQHRSPNLALLEQQRLRWDKAQYGRSKEHQNQCI